MSFKYYFFIVLGAIFFGLSPILVRLSTASGTVAALYRVSVSFLLFFIIFYYSKKSERKINRRGLLLSILGGVVFSINISLYYISFNYTFVSNATFLASTSVVWVGIWTYFIKKERFGKGYLLGVMFSLCGVYLLLKGNVVSSKINIGDIIALLSGISYAMFIVINEKFQKYSSSISYLFVSHLSASIILFIITVNILSEVVLFDSLKVYFYLISIGVISQGLGLFIVVRSQLFVPAVHTSLLLLFEPIATIIFAKYILKEVLDSKQVLGVITLMAGVILATYSINTYRR